MVILGGNASACWQQDALGKIENYTTNQQSNYGSVHSLGYLYLRLLTYLTLTIV